MKPNQLIRAVGVAGIVAAYLVYGVLGDINGPVAVPFLGAIHPLVIVVLGILTIVMPEWIESLPFGPTRGGRVPKR